MPQITYDEVMDLVEDELRAGKHCFACLRPLDSPDSDYCNDECKGIANAAADQAAADRYI